MGADCAVIQIVTRCGSAEEFIERFAPFTTETDIAVPASPDVSEGSVRQFVICLADGSAMMKGRCEVTPGDAPAPSQPALMRLRFREMDAHSAGTHLRLMEWRAFSPEAQAAPIPEAVTSSLAVLASESEGAPVDISAVTVVRDTPPSSDAETTQVSPLPSAPPATVSPPAIVVPAVFTASAGARLDRARRIGRRVAPYASGLVVGLLLGIAIKSGSTALPVAGAPNLARPPVTAPPRVAAPPASAAPAPSAGSAPSAAPAPADDPTPESRQGAGAHGLERSLAKVVVTSSPEHAFIKVNRHRLGRAPREISAHRFERVRIEASLPGYRRWKKTIYLEEAELKLDVKLVRTRELAARQATPPVAPPTRATTPSSVGASAAVAAR